MRTPKILGLGLVLAVSLSLGATDSVQGLVCLKVVPQELAANPLSFYLERELQRQAILMAARDLGSLTRDEALGEPFSPLPPGKAITLEPTCLGDLASEKQQIRIKGPGGATRELELPLPKSFVDHLCAMELGARTTIRAALRDWGVPGPAVHPDLKTDAEAPVPAEVRELLGRLSPLSQFAAVRRLHELVKQTGESPSRLRALAQGYATLARLCEPLYSIQRKVFLARAYLYCMRDFNLRESPTTHFYFAYCCAMQTDIPWANYELRQGEGMGAKWKREGKAVPPVPPWVPILDHYIRCRFDQLAQDADSAKEDPSLRELALFLRFSTLEWQNSIVMPYASAKAAYTADSENTRLVAGMCYMTGLGIQRDATDKAMQIMPRMTARGAQILTHLPIQTKAALAAATAGNQQLAAAAKALLDGAASDIQEPSLAVLGRLIQEFNFLFVRLRLRFLSEWWGVPTQEAAISFRPLIEGHQFQPFLQLYEIDSRDISSRQKALSAMRIQEPSGFAVGILLPINNLRLLPQEQVSQWLNTTRKDFSNRTSTDCRSMLNMLAPGMQHKVMKELLLSWIEGEPNNPEPVSRLIHLLPDDKTVQDNILKWEKDLGFHPVMLRALQSYHFRKKDWQRVVSINDALQKFCPDPIAWTDAAKAWLNLGYPEKWIETLESKVLALEDPGLLHSKVHDMVASHHMEKRDYPKAIPHALKAAQSGSFEGMECAAWCFEKMEDWKNAESWFRKILDRYDNPVPLYFYCLRTGKGDITRVTPSVLLKSQPHDRALVLLAEKKATEAKALFKSAVYDFDGEYLLLSWGLMLALMADEDGDTLLRDQALAKVIGHACTHGDDNERLLHGLAVLMQNTLKKDAKASLDETAVSQLFGNLEKNLLLGLFASRYEMLHGSTQKAQEYFIKTFNVFGPQYRSPFANALIAIWGKALNLDLVGLEGKRPVRSPKKADPDLEF